ncbi:MAG: hypothetical protein IKO75_02735 [Bacteroidales bacterium]|nr:hypothetical protein [Bacteroidales bacterium]
MKKYTNKILIITAIVLVLGIIIGYTIDFQTGYRSGRIKYEKIEKDSMNVLNFNGLDEIESYADSLSENQPETSHQ